MKIAFKRRNGHCPEWEYDGIRYYLFEDYDGSWTLMSRKKGFLKKNRFYRSGLYGIHPWVLLDRFFRNKKSERPSFDSYRECLKDAKRSIYPKSMTGNGPDLSE